MTAKLVRPARVSAVLILVTAGLWSLDWYLAKTEVSELLQEARRAFLDGSQLLQQGKLGPAVDLLSRAHGLERKNSTYALALVNALVAEGKRDEAEPLLEETLQRRANYGPANLTAARLMVSESRIAEAESYYHRAIYGEWPSNAAASIQSARLELVDLLVKNGRKEALLAELLPLQEEADGNLELRKRIAHLFFVSGSLSRAADVYRSLIDSNPQDADLYVGRGQIELARGQYRAAAASFILAFRRRPGDPSIRENLALSSLVSGIDPTLRQLSAVEKYRRSLRILDLARGAYGKCLTSQKQPPPVEPATAKTPAHVTNELAEEMLAQAEEIWRQRILACGANTSREEEPLRLIMAKLSQ